MDDEKFEVGDEVVWVAIDAQPPHNVVKRTGYFGGFRANGGLVMFLHQHDGTLGRYCFEDGQHFRNCMALFHAADTQGIEAEVAECSPR